MILMLLKAKHDKRNNDYLEPRFAKMKDVKLNQFHLPRPKGEVNSIMERILIRWDPRLGPSCEDPIKVDPKIKMPSFGSFYALCPWHC